MAATALAAFLLYGVRSALAQSAGGVAYADSGSFTLDTTGLPTGGGGVAYADSGNFTLDTTGLPPGGGGVAYADSGNFTLDTTGLPPGGGGVTYADSGSFTLGTIAGVASQLQVLLPGESAAPNTPTGKTGTPLAQVAGMPVNVTVSAVDAKWNPVGSAAPTVALSSPDPNANLPGPGTLSNGSRVFSVTFQTAGSWTVTATDTANQLLPGTSSAVTVNSGSATQLEVLLPGETAAPGKSPGKRGAPLAQAPKRPFNVSVSAVDAYFNPVSAATPTVAITSSDSSATLPANKALVNGMGAFQVTLNRPGTWIVTATDTAHQLATGTSSAVSVQPTFTGQAGSVLTTLYSFTGGNDGGQPYAGLVQGRDGYL